MGCCSGFAALFGALMIMFAFFLTSNDVIENMEKEDEDIKEGKEFIFTLLLVFSLMTIGISLLGCCFKCCKNRFFNVLYGSLLLPTWVIIIVIGTLATFASTAATDELEKQCLSFTDITESYTVDGSTEIDISLDIYDSLQINEYMCSASCPCDTTDKSNEWLSNPPIGREDTGTNSLVIGDLSYSTRFTSYKDCIEEKALF
jgi:hypothetical protein